MRTFAAACSLRSARICEREQASAITTRPMQFVRYRSGSTDGCARLEMFEAFPVDCLVARERLLGLFALREPSQELSAIQCSLSAQCMVVEGERARAHFLASSSQTTSFTLRTLIGFFFLSLSLRGRCLPPPLAPVAI